MYQIINDIRVCSVVSCLIVLSVLNSPHSSADFIREDQFVSKEHLRNLIETRDVFDNEIVDKNNSLEKLSVPEVHSDLCNCSIASEQSSNVASPFGLRRNVRSRGLNIHPSPIPDVSDECNAILQEFAYSVANFTYCTLTNARPITVCQDCIESYLDVEDWFQNISSTSGFDCGSQLFNKDYLLVVQSTYKFVTNFWETAECINCYSKEDMSKAKLCNFTLEFFSRLNDVMTCINSTEITLEDKFGGKNMSVICDRCRIVYIHLNEFYEEMNTNYNNRLCYDVVDAMNITRHSWSSTYMCSHTEVDSMGVLLLSGGVCFLPILYYTANRLATSAKESKVVLQKRMSFVQTSYNSTSLHR